MTVVAATHRHPGYALGRRELRVSSARLITADVLHLELTSPDDVPLVGFEPGSHLVVEAGDARNAYSLLGDGVAPRHYSISVLRRGGGAGSDWLHEHAREGESLMIEGPRSLFAPRYEQRHALLVAGGIGITPILSHARSAARWGRRAEIVYGYRPGQGAHLEEIRAAAHACGMPLREAHDRHSLREVLAARFADQPLGTHAYACGPIGMLETYLDLGRAAGWPASRLHLERFEAPELDPGRAFEAVIGSTGRVVAVPSGVSLLDALTDAGLDIPNLCRQGVCGECRIPVRAATLEHRDFVLSDDERKAGDAMMCCVSRGESIEVLV